MRSAIVRDGPADGAVALWVGRAPHSKGAGQFNRATQALRQTGSAFKPFRSYASRARSWEGFSLR